VAMLGDLVTESRASELVGTPQVVSLPD